MDETSATLLNRLRSPGDQEAWRRFVELYTPLLFHWTQRLELQSQDGADLIQDVLAHLFQKLPGFRYDAARSFRSWLHTVMVNKWREKSRKRVVAAQGDDGQLQQLPDEDVGECFSEEEYRQYLVRRALEVMKSNFQETTWQACWLLTVENQPAAEVARALGISEAAAYVAKSRVLRRIRQELEGLLE